MSSHTETEKQLLNMLLGAANGLQMVALVSHNFDEDLDKLDELAQEKIETADDDLRDTLKDRLTLLRSVREQQSDVIFLRFDTATTTGDLEAFAFELEEIGLTRLERIVSTRMKGAPPETAVMLSDKLRQVTVLRRELKPIKDGLFRYLATDNLADARQVLLDAPDLLLTKAAERELMMVDSSDMAVRERLLIRKKLWRQVYGEHIGEPIANPMEIPGLNDDKAQDEQAAASETTPGAPEPIETDDADRLMQEVYDLLDQAVGNAMVAFGIYRKNKSGRADEALKLLTNIHNEVKSDKDSGESE